MGIWIRNQDKTMLLNINGLSTGISSADACVFGRVENTDLLGMIIGSYPTEAEAIQVLDMIQERIVHQEQVRLMPSQDWITPSIVFQMPPAGFSQTNKKPAVNLARDLDLYKEALTMLLDSNDYITLWDEEEEGEE